MKIGIVGGGGIGSYYAALLADGGNQVVLLTRGPHLEAIRAHGLELHMPEGIRLTKPEATDDAARLSGCEVVIVSVKGYSLGEVAPALASAARGDRGATIIPLLNGVDAADRLETLGVPRTRVAGGLARISVVRTAPGIVDRRSPIDQVVVGSFPGASDGRAEELDRLDRLVGALVAVGTEATHSQEITRDLWRKLAFIVPMNVICGLCRTGMGAPLSTERGRWLMAGSLAEIVAVSRAAGGNLSDEDHHAVHEGLLQVPGHVKPSFLLDLERGGPTELEMLAGAVSRLGHEHGVPTPIHDVATAAFEAAVLPS